MSKPQIRRELRKFKESRKVGGSYRQSFKNIGLVIAKARALTDTR